MAMTVASIDMGVGTQSPSTPPGASVVSPSAQKVQPELPVNSGGG